MLSTNASNFNESDFKQREHSIIMARVLVLRHLFNEDLKAIREVLYNQHCLNIDMYLTYPRLVKELETMNKTPLVKALLDMGFSTVAIARMLNISQPSVSYHKTKEDSKPYHSKLIASIIMHDDAQRKKALQSNIEHTYW